METSGLLFKVKLWLRYLQNIYPPVYSCDIYGYKLQVNKISYVMCLEKNMPTLHKNLPSLLQK